MRWVIGLVFVIGLLIRLYLAITFPPWAWAIPGAHNLIWWAVLPWFVYLGISRMRRITSE